MGTSIEVLQTTYAKEIASIEKQYYKKDFQVTNEVTSAAPGGIKV